METLIRQEKIAEFCTKNKAIQKTTEGREGKGDRDRGDKAPIGKIKMILGGLVIGGSSKPLKKAYVRELNSVYPWFPPSKTPRYNKLDIVFSEKDTRGIRQPHNDLLVIMLKMEEFNMHRVLIDNGSIADIIYLPFF